MWPWDSELKSRDRKQFFCFEINSAITIHGYKSISAVSDSQGIPRNLAILTNKYIHKLIINLPLYKKRRDGSSENFRLLSIARFCYWWKLIFGYEILFLSKLIAFSVNCWIYSGWSDVTSKFTCHLSSNIERFTTWK